MLRVEVAQAWPDRQQLHPLQLAEGATVADALAAAGLVVPAQEWVAVAVHGVVARPAQLLNDGDRVELLRPLLADPKENRRRRARGGQ
jgi:putative ubiquitin-RnfH superfamily antitoxin RatB of RatAB toxin-antitoxin module